MVERPISRVGEIVGLLVYALLFLLIAPLLSDAKI